jgi:glycosyltransferase involved in cell wall biosynthesis
MLSTVIPVYNERESLDCLHGELDEVARAGGYDLDIIFVDDGSTDGSWKVISALAARDPRVRGIRFRRNFGKAAALSAGFRSARGELVMTLDADLQDDPHEIPRFLAAMNGDVHVMSGWKQVRYDPWHKVLPSRVFNALISWLTGVRLHDHVCGMKCYRREVLGEVRIYGELHRFLPVLAAARGFAVGELVIRHRPRKFGRSKYGVRRFVRGFLDLLSVKFLTSFGHRPQHLLGALGLLSLALAGLGFVYLAVYGIAGQLSPAWEPTPYRSSAVIFSLGALLLGGQLLSIGLLAELITAYQFRDAETYSIAERTAACADKTTARP